MRRERFALGTAFVVLLGLALAGAWLMFVPSRPSEAAVPTGLDLDGVGQLVAVVATPETRARGVHDHPLEPGQSLGFAFPAPTRPRWTMRGVPYPLELSAYGPDLDLLGRWFMPACPRDPCGTFEAPATASLWVETRPG